MSCHQESLFLHVCQFDEDKAAELVNWVPRKLAPHVRCIFSMIPGTAQHSSLTQREPQPQVLQLQPLNDETRKVGVLATVASTLGLMVFPAEAGTQLYRHEMKQEQRLCSRPLLMRDCVSTTSCSMKSRCHPCWANSPARTLCGCPLLARSWGSLATTDRCPTRSTS